MAHIKKFKLLTKIRELAVKDFLLGLKLEIFDGYLSKFKDKALLFPDNPKMAKAYHKIISQYQKKIRKIKRKKNKLKSTKEKKINKF